METNDLTHQALWAATRYMKGRLRVLEKLLDRAKAPDVIEDYEREIDQIKATLKPMYAVIGEATVAAREAQDRLQAGADAITRFAGTGGDSAAPEQATGTGGVLPAVTRGNP